MAIGAPDVKIIRITPSISTSAYSAGHQIGVKFTLTDAAPDDKGGCVLTNVTVFDKLKQKKGITFFFFSASPTVTSTDRTTLDITDANSVGKDLGFMSVTTSNYKDRSGNSVGKSIDSPISMAPDTGKDLFGIAMMDEAATYGSSSDLQWDFHFLQGTGR